MKCPKCKNGEVKYQVSIKGFIFRKKIIDYYCPLCDYKNKHEFRLSKDDVQVERLHQTNLERKTRQTFDTRREEIK